MYEISFLGGLLLGFASSLHCAAMCGAIASSLMIGLVPDGTVKRRTGVHALNQLGRAISYVAAGAVVGFVGDAAFLSSLDREAGFALLRWGGAVALGWIGLSIAGWLPPLTIIDRLTAPITRRLSLAGSGAVAGLPVIGPVLAGMVWGLLPCGMVYGALFYALLSGHAFGGAMVMAGFALGTLPSVTATAIGMSGLSRIGQRERLRTATGLAIAGLAVASLLIPATQIGSWCRTG